MEDLVPKVVSSPIVPLEDGSELEATELVISVFESDPDLVVNVPIVTCVFCVLKAETLTVLLKEAVSASFEKELSVV